MKIFLYLLLSLFAISSLHADAVQEKIERGLRKAFKENEKDQRDDLKETLKEMLAVLEKENVKSIDDYFPDKIDTWEGEKLQKEQEGKSLKVSRIYEDDEKEVELRLSRDTPMLDIYLRLMKNEDLIRLSGAKTHKVDGFTGIEEEKGGKLFLRFLLNDETLFELEGSKGTEMRDLIRIARRLDLKAITKLL